MTDQTAWRNRIVGHGKQKASEFLAHPDNWRIHPQEQREAMRGVLCEVGWVQTVIVNKRSGYLIDGHERVWQALQNGDQLVPYVEVDLSEDEERFVLLTFDPLGSMAQVNEGKLVELLQEVSTADQAVQRMLSDCVAAGAGLSMERSAHDVPEGVEVPEGSSSPGGKQDTRMLVACPVCGHEFNPLEVLKQRSAPDDVGE